MKRGGKISVFLLMLIVASLIPINIANAQLDHNQELLFKSLYASASFGKRIHKYHYVWYANGYWWAIKVYDNKIYIAKSTDRSSWSYTNTGLSVYQNKNPWVVVDDEGNAHVLYYAYDSGDGRYEWRYDKILTYANGTIKVIDKDIDDEVLYRSSSSTTFYEIVDWGLDGQGYPYVIYYSYTTSSKEYVTLIKMGDGKDGDWINGQSFTINSKADDFEKWSDAIAIPLLNTRDLIVVYGDRDYYALETYGWVKVSYINYQNNSITAIADLTPYYTYHSINRWLGSPKKPYPTYNEAYFYLMGGYENSPPPLKFNGGDTIYGGYDISKTNWRASVFTPSENFTAYYLSARIKGDSGNDIFPHIAITRTTADGKPDMNQILTEITSTQFDGKALSDTEYLWINASLPKPVRLNTTEKYAVVFHYHGTFSGYPPKVSCGQLSETNYISGWYSSDQGESWSSSTICPLVKLYGKESSTEGVYVFRTIDAGQNWDVKYFNYNPLDTAILRFDEDGNLYLIHSWNKTNIRWFSYDAIHETATGLWNQSWGIENQTIGWTTLLSTGEPNLFSLSPSGNLTTLIPFSNYYSNSKYGAVFYKFNDTTTQFIEDKPPSYIPSITSCGISDLEGCGNWVFAYGTYTFYVNGIRGNLYASFEFTDGTGKKAKAIYYPQNDTVETPYGEEIITIVDASCSINETTHQYNYTFQVHILQSIVDAYDVELTFTYAGDNGTVTQTLSDYFNIYSMGGRVKYYSSGWAGHGYNSTVPYGEPFEIFAADSTTDILLWPQTFDVRPFPIQDASLEPALLDMLAADWHIYMPWTKPDIFMYPTSRLRGNPPQTARAYHSYPFSIIIFDNATDTLRKMYMEKNLRRVVHQYDNETVKVQFYVMQPFLDRTGQWRVQDNSIYETGSAHMIVQMRFDAQGHIDAYNSSSSTWVDLVNVTAYQWYNVTCLIDLQSQTVDIYIDDVLQADDMPFVESATQVKTVYIGTINTVAARACFYVDDIRAWTDWEGNYGGWCRAEIYYRNFQHLHMLWGFGIEAPDGLQVMEAGYVEFGVDTCFNDTDWIPQWKVRITPVDAQVDSRNIWVKYKIEWYHRGVVRKTDYLYALYEQHPSLEQEQREKSSFFLDLWFGRENASSVVKGRINAEFYGMSDKSLPIVNIITGRKWLPKVSDITISQVTFNLEDDGGDVRNIREVKMCRLWAYIYRNNVSQFHYRIMDIDIFEVKTSEASLLEGVDTPILVETRIPYLHAGGFLAPLYRIMASMGALVFKAFLNGVKSMAFTLASLSNWLLYITFGITWAELWVSISQALGFLTNLTAYLSQLISNLWAIIPSILQVLFKLLGPAIFHIGWSLTVLLNFIDTILDVFAGVYFGIGNIWEDYQLQYIFTLMLLMSIWWIFERCRREHSFDPLIQTVSIWVSVITFVFDIMYKLIKFIIDLIFNLIEAIPVVE